MKNVQVIDGAANCHFPVFQMTAREFKAVFPGRGQDIAFAEEVLKRLGKKKTAALLAPVWKRPIRSRTSSACMARCSTNSRTGKRTFRARAAIATSILLA